MNNVLRITSFVRILCYGMGCYSHNWPWDEREKSVSWTSL